MQAGLMLTDVNKINQPQNPSEFQAEATKFSFSDQRPGRRHHRFQYFLRANQPKIRKHVITSDNITILRCSYVTRHIFIGNVSYMFSRSIIFSLNFHGPTQRWLKPSKVLLLCPSSLPPPVKRRGSTRWWWNLHDEPWVFWRPFESAE